LGQLRKKLIVKKRLSYKKLAFTAFLVIIVVTLWWLHQVRTQADLLSYASSHKLETGAEITKGNGQIYYVFKDKHHFVTHDDKNHLGPTASGKYITWLDETNGQYQVILYNLQTKAKLALSVIGNNTSPSIDQAHVAWQTVVNDQAVIMYFNGVNVRQISGAQAAIRPFVRNNQVLYAQQGTLQGIWQTVLYDDATKKSKVVVSGTAAQAAWPRFEGDSIKTSLRNSAKYYN
jgi:hypothetical protein